MIYSDILKEERHKIYNDIEKHVAPFPDAGTKGYVAENIKKYGKLHSKLNNHQLLEAIENLENKNKYLWKIIDELKSHSYHKGYKNPQYKPVIRAKKTRESILKEEPFFNSDFINK